MATGAYDSNFYNSQIEGSYKSAQIIVPIVLGLLSVRSVCDVGCGVGTWLRAFMEAGVEDVLGLDGEYVPRNMLQIPEARFRPMNLTEPLLVSQPFDLVVSLEVVEHLPNAVSERFIDYLTSLAPAVLFSGAIPGQGGREHVNEQWQSFWAERFSRRGFAVADVIRPAVWANADVEWWYRQNAFLYVRSHLLETIPRLSVAPTILDTVHPENFRSRCASPNLEYLGFIGVVRRLPNLLRRAVVKRIRHA